MGEVKNTASTLVNQAAGFLGNGIGQALGFIPSVGAVMELIGKGANIAGTVAGATGLGGEKAGTALNLLGSVANGASSDASAVNTEKYGPPMPNADQMPQETYGPAMPPFKNPSTQVGQDEWFKPLDQMLKEAEEHQARGEFLDDSGNWQRGPMPGTEQPKSVVFRPSQSPVDSNKTTIDPTITKPYQTGEDAVIKATDTVNKVLGQGDFLKDIAYVESKYGEDPNTFSDKVQTPGKAAEPYYGGIWQVDKIAFEDTKDIKSHPGLAKQHQKIKDELGIDWNKVKYQDLTSPLNSALAARLKLMTVPDKIPGDTEGRAAYWKNHYNTGAGKGTSDKFQRDIDARNQKNAPR